MGKTKQSIHAVLIGTLELMQQDYWKAKKAFDQAEAKIEAIEKVYIADNGITNEDGTIPSASWMIDNERVFEKMHTDLKNQYERFATTSARMALKKSRRRPDCLWPENHAAGQQQKES